MFSAWADPWPCTGKSSFASMPDQTAERGELDDIHQQIKFSIFVPNLKSLSLILNL